MELGNRFCSFGRIDPSTGKLVELGLLEADKPDEDLPGHLCLQHPDLQRSAGKVVIGFWTDHAMLIPSPFYNEESGRHLELLYGASHNLVMQSDRLPSWNLHAIYRLPQLVQDMISNRWKESNAFHHYSTILKSLDGDQRSSILLDFRADQFSVVVLRRQELLLAQTLSYSTPEDVLFQLLKICSRFSFSRPETRLLVSGWIDQDSAISIELEKYFLDLEYEEPLVEADENLKDYPAHYFTPLSKLAACG